MDKEQTVEAIKVMQAYVDGGDIEMSDKLLVWQEVFEPFWNWFVADYRIKRENSP